MIFVQIKYNYTNKTNIATTHIAERNDGWYFVAWVRSTGWVISIYF